VRRLAGLVVLLVLASLLDAPARATTPPGMVLAFAGDSITAGYGVTAAWRDGYPRRASDKACGQNCAPVLVVGHAGQCLVYPGCGYGSTLLTTFGPEVLQATPKPTTVVVEIGRNDLSHATDTDLESAYKTLANDAAAAGVRVIVGTIPPAGQAYQWFNWTELQRQRINQWIRSTFGADVADFEAVLLAPNSGSPGYMWGGYDSGDHVHPADLGAVRMADMLPLDRLQ
jgi:lysophospholipase L1-like esterase